MTVVPLHSADVLDPVVKRVAFDERCVVEHSIICLTAACLLRRGWVSASGPVRAIVPLGDPERAFHDVINAFEVIVELVGCSVRVVGIAVATIIMYATKSTRRPPPSACDMKSVRPARPPSETAGEPRASRSQSKSGHASIGVRHRHIRLVRLIGLVVT